MEVIMEIKKVVMSLRDFVNVLYSEGHEEVFTFSILNDKVQVADFDLEAVDLAKNRYPRAYAKAKECLKVAQMEYPECEAINVLICDEVPEEVFMVGKVLKVMNLNVEP